MPTPARRSRCCRGRWRGFRPGTSGAWTLPEPLRPRIPRNSPVATLNETLSSACRTSAPVPPQRIQRALLGGLHAPWGSSKRLDTPSTMTAGGAGRLTGLARVAVSMASDRSKRLTLIAAILGSGVVFLDGTVVNVALPAIREDLGTGLSEQQWIVEAYLLTLASLLLVGGSMGDRLGRRRIFITGLTSFCATSVLCALAPTVELLIAARALQGAAGALLVPSSLALITAIFSGEERGAAIGTWTAWTGISFVAGPL